MLTQKIIDDFIEMTELKAMEVKDEESALELYKSIQELSFLSKDFFIPDIVVSWEEMALSFITSQHGLWYCEHCAKIIKVYYEAFELFDRLEIYLAKGLIDKDRVFEVVDNYNNYVMRFNKACQTTSYTRFPIYLFKNPLIRDLYIGGK